jgi:signal peptidase II
MLLRLVVAMLIAVALDVVTKFRAEQVLSYQVPVPVIGQYVQLTLGYNTGVAFGLLANSGAWLLALTSLIIAGLMVWLLISLRTGQLPAPAAWPAGMILGGAIANLVDRAVDGRVTDFLDVGLGALRWPTFNLADSCIMVSVAWLLAINLAQKDATEISYEQNHTNP